MEDGYSNNCSEKKDIFVLCSITKLHVSCVTLLQKRRQILAKCSKSNLVCKITSNSSDFLGICCFPKHSEFGCCFSGRHGSTVESLTMSTEKQQRSGKIWLMKTHQKHCGRRHRPANVYKLVIKKKRINSFSCHVWEEQRIASWNGGREIEISFNKAQNDWKWMPKENIQFQSLQLQKQNETKQNKTKPWYDVTDPDSEGEMVNMTFWGTYHTYDLWFLCS